MTKVIFVIYMKSHSFHNIRNDFNIEFAFLKNVFRLGSITGQYMTDF